MMGTTRIEEGRKEGGKEGSNGEREEGKYFLNG